MKNALWLRTFTFLLSLMLATRTTAGKLNIGDPAPKLQVAKWIQGDAVQEFETNHIYIVEFWSDLVRVVP
jgi:hypothetical protein